MLDFFHLGLGSLDSAVAGLIDYESERQARKLILIPSESQAPVAVREALGSVFQNIYAEGYPDPSIHGAPQHAILDYGVQLSQYRRYSDRRYYKGVEYVNVLEALARRRAAEAFATDMVPPEEIWANVQPLSGSPANNAVYAALVPPGSTVMGMDLLHGGHLTHGSPANRSGKLYDIVSYGIDQETEQLEPYAWIAGFEDSAALREALDVTCERIHDIYRGIFGRDEWKDRTSVLLDESTATEESLTVLTEHGFIEPKAACNRLRRLATDTEHTYLQAKTQRRFQAILPRLLACASEESEPDRCLQQFERILGGVGSRSAFYDIMKDQPQSMQILIAVAGGSEFLTECLHRNPSLIETLGRQSYLRDALTEEALSDYGRELALAHPGEEPLERLVRLRNGAEMRVGVRFLLRLSELGSIVSELSVLAELILKELYEASRIEPDVTEEDDLLVVGLGKLGGRELNIASDLDLACFYGDPGGGDPARALTRSSNEYYNPWVRRLLELGGKRFSRGTLYELDLRLRPYGRNSPQATTLDSLAEYFRDKAWFWERMAYSRARPVQGAPRWRKAFETWREEAIFGPGFTPQNLMDLHDMRKRIERQKGSQVIKAGPGGLIDVEFASQAVALAHGTEHPGLREGSTVHLLEEAARLGLVDPVRAESLVKGYLFLRDIENRIRLIKHASLDSLPEGEAELDAVARRIFPPDSSERTGAALVARVQSVTSSLRQDYVAVLEAIL